MIAGMDDCPVRGKKIHFYYPDQYNEQKKKHSLPHILEEKNSDDETLLQGHIVLLALRVFPSPPGRFILPYEGGFFSCDPDNDPAMCPAATSPLRAAEKI